MKEVNNDGIYSKENSLIVIIVANLVGSQNFDVTGIIFFPSCPDTTNHLPRVLLASLFFPLQIFYYFFRKKNADCIINNSNFSAGGGWVG